MPEVKSHLQGEPCWAELATRDVEGALKFYSGLFGWEDDARPMGPGMTYHMQNIGNLVAAALCQLGEHDPPGTPSHWRVYFSVKSAGETAKKIKAAGGTVLIEPMDVLDSGRMVVAQDPSGAVVSFWQAANHTGYTVTDEPGAITWNELLTRDTKKALAFYKSVLGVSAEEMAMGMDYNILKVKETSVAGIMAMPKEVPSQVPSYWAPYFAVANADASAKKAAALGGKVVAGPQDVAGVGRWVTLTDPQGAVLSILQPAPMP